ncbi:TetR family transcriptional regulator [Kribbella albertanoniae]|uniref:TetR/AcrR family transcriptional regulator n=1 Tax=Kribbella albertanoniae TaxID=1266829 RepID=A0A4R4NZN1_9ACTN|nr:TetR/AcrR family transcriptional regulator [Kribbella albertanoniae]TDC15381.1 TetR/AcrR family transcriptional regulator [Kribbella albertanoniae]
MTGTSPRRKTGGRQAQIGLADIEREGLRLGLADLTVNGVAGALGVTPAALYRHVDGKFGLESVVGEAILAELHIIDDPADDLNAHLLSFALQLHTFIVDRPGLAAYLQTLFPRGASGLRLQREAVEALGRRGYGAAGAVMLSGTVASLAINLSAAEERHRPYHDGPHQRELEKVYALLASDEVLAPVHAELPAISSGDYFLMVMTACIRGLTTAAPPGRPVIETLTDLGLTD